jgi:putative ABC transport system permease protein
MASRLRTRLASLFRRARYERELDVELRFHVDMLTEQNVRAGMPCAAARDAALRAFGAVDRVKEDVRETWLSRLAETMAQDVRYGARSLRRNPGFALVVLLTMALGIGANTAIFSVVYGVLLKPLPYEDADRLVVLHQQRPRAGVQDMRFSYKEIQDYRTARSLEDVVELHDMWFILLGQPEPQRVATSVVSANFFDVLGVQPLYGRTFQQADDKPGAPAVLLLSHAYWQRNFGADPSVVGRVFRMNDRPHQVIGVLPPLPEYPVDVQADVYMPTSACPFRSDPHVLEERNSRMMRAIARVRGGVSLDKARADLDIVSTRLQREYPDSYPPDRGYRTIAVPLQDELTNAFKTTLKVLLGTAGFVLLIVCASVANLMLARMVRREQEVAVRSVLGASRGRLVRQLLTESTLLAVAGGLVGLVLAQFGLDLLVAFAERFTTRAAEIAIDRHVLAYTLVLSVLTGLLFGSIPALTGGLSVTPGVRTGMRSTLGRLRVRNTLIVVQIAASFMLLIGAGLTIRTVIKLREVDPGFSTDNILTMRIDLNFTKYRGARAAEFWKQIDERIKAVPGAVKAGGAGTFPLNDQGPFSQPIRIKGREISETAGRPTADVRQATPDYFATIGQSLLAGRTFLPSEIWGTAPVVVVNRSFARHHWADRDPIGQQVSGNDGETWSTVVGVVADTKQQLTEPVQDEIYIPAFQVGYISSSWLVRTTFDPGVMERQLRAAVHSIDPEQPIYNFRTLAEVVRRRLLRPN